MSFNIAIMPAARLQSVGKMANTTEAGFQSGVLAKLVIFSILMAVVPIGTYFGSLKYYFNGSTTQSAISAVIAANVVLVGYVVLAFREETAGPPVAGAASVKKVQ